VVSVYMNAHVGRYAHRQITVTARASQQHPRDTVTLTDDGRAKHFNQYNTTITQE